MLYVSLYSLKMPFLRHFFTHVKGLPFVSPTADVDDVSSPALSLNPAYGADPW